MPDSVLDRVRAEIRARLEQSRAAAEEYRRLEAAEAALRGMNEKTRPTNSKSARPTSVGRARRSGKPAPDRARGSRAPRGANRAAVLRVVGERPGVGVAELASASGVSRPVLYNLLATLEKSGEIKREELPAGTKGYRVAAAPMTASMASSAAPSSAKE
jgi:hypothetical protein